MNEALQAQMCKCLECAHKAGTGSVPFLLPPRMRSRPGPWIARSTVPTCGDRWRGVNPLDTCTGKSLLCSGKRSGSEFCDPCSVQGGIMSSPDPLLLTPTSGRSTPELAPNSSVERSPSTVPVVLTGNGSGVLPSLAIGKKSQLTFVLGVILRSEESILITLCQLGLFAGSSVIGVPQGLARVEKLGRNVGYLLTLKFPQTNSGMVIEARTQ